MTQPQDFWIQPDWPAPAAVRAVATTREQGFSRGEYAGLNLGIRVQDDPNVVRRNRDYLRQHLALPSEPVWLHQVHSNIVQVLTSDPAYPRDSIQADAGVTHHAGVICVAQTADCLPVLLCDDKARVVAAVHAGWRGLANGIINNTLAAMREVCPDLELMAWLGPAIGPEHFEVGEDVYRAYTDARFGESALHNAAAFSPLSQPAGAAKKYLADIYQLARNCLRAQGVERIYGGEYCTYRQQDLFYSFRRDSVTGRMASLIWLEP